MKRRRGNEQDDEIEAQCDQRLGMWTQLQLIDLDVAFCLRMRRAHPERQGMGSRGTLLKEAKRLGL